MNKYKLFKRKLECMHHKEIDTMNLIKYQTNKSEPNSEIINLHSDEDQATISATISDLNQMENKNSMKRTKQGHSIKISLPNKEIIKKSIDKPEIHLKNEENPIAKIEITELIRKLEKEFERSAEKCVGIDNELIYKKKNTNSLSEDRKGELIQKLEESIIESTMIEQRIDDLKGILYPKPKITEEELMILSIEYKKKIGNSLSVTMISLIEFFSNLI